jgi:hypothetical protein
MIGKGSWDEKVLAAQLRLDEGLYMIGIRLESMRMRVERT